MKYTQIKIGLLSIALLLSSANVVAAAKPATQSVKAEVVMPEAAVAQGADERSSRDEDEDEDHCPPLKIANLCANRIKAKSIATKKLCSHKLHTDHLTAEHATVTEKLCANDLRAPKACLGDLTVQNVCSNGVIKGADIQPCAKYVATAVFKADTTYTLGDFVNFDTFIDDPNGNLSSFPNFHYTAPLTGYYMLTVEIDSNNLQGANPVLGIPIANLELTLNGAIGRQSFLPYLGFNNTQNSLISSLVHLTVGDQVGVKYNVGVIDPVTGFSNYVGTIDIKGNGTPVNESLFRIIYLASTCVDLPCQGCDFTCESRHDEPCPKLDCNPCCHRD